MGRLATSATLHRLRNTHVESGHSDYRISLVAQCARKNTAPYGSGEEASEQHDNGYEHALTLASLTEGEVVALWDAISRSLRPRPNGFKQIDHLIRLIGKN